MTTHQESIIDQFTRQAVPFSKLDGHTNEESLHLLMEMASVSEQDIVLDVACGSGIVSCAFATVASHVTGIDITPAMLKQAEILAQQKSLTNHLMATGGYRDTTISRCEFFHCSESLRFSSFFAARCRFIRDGSCVSSWWSSPHC